MTNKYYLYIGHYIDEEGAYILKVGQTNDLHRRKLEHNLKYKKATKHKMPEYNEFHYDWTLPLSKYNSMRFEDKLREQLIKDNIGEYIRNDRFCCGAKTEEIKITLTIKKTYTIKV